MPPDPTTTSSPTAARVAIVAAVRAFVSKSVEPLFVDRVGYCRDCGWRTEHDDDCVYLGIVAELAALERTVAAEETTHD